jgi:hypothetical protein
LQQQTATAEVLKVISSSLSNTQPAFEAIVPSGLKLFPESAHISIFADVLSHLRCTIGYVRPLSRLGGPKADGPLPAMRGRGTARQGACGPAVRLKLARKRVQCGIKCGVLASPRSMGEQSQ